MAIYPGHLTGVLVWRIASYGTTPVHLVSIQGDKARVCSQGRVSRWAKKPIYVATADLFDDHVAAIDEYRRRRHIAKAMDPHASLNLTTPVP